MAGVKRRKLNDMGSEGLIQKVNLTASEASLPDAPIEETDADNEDEREIGKEARVGKKTFQDLGIIDPLCEACAELKWEYPTPIQNEAIPLALAGRDVIGLAETGSGKTGAFLLPMLQALMENPRPFFGLVMAPTRELAFQISKECEALGSIIQVRCVVLVGGMDFVAQSIALGKKPHVIVATPGRLQDHLENTKGFSLRGLKFLVMDEADRILDLDFGPVVDKILKLLPREGRRTSLFSATMTSKVDSLQRASLQNPLRVQISSSSHQTVASLVQRYIFIPFKDKDTYLVYMLNDLAGHSTIVFARTVHETQRLAFLLRALGFGAIPLHGQLSQSSRLGALNKFRAGSRDVLVATDVAARGLDIRSVEIVINFDLPANSETYVHRVGRTARAGKSGKAISIVTQYDFEVWQRIEAALGRQLPEHPTERSQVEVLGERVGEAQRAAVKELKDLAEKKRGKGGGKRSRYEKYGAKRGRQDMDREEE